MTTEETIPAEDMRALALKVYPPNLEFIQKCISEAKEHARRGEFECEVDVCCELDKEHWAGKFQRKFQYCFWNKFFPSPQFQTAVSHLRQLGYSVDVSDYTYRGELDYAYLRIRW